MFYKKSYSQKFHNIHRKTPALESLLNKVAGFLRTPILKNICKWLLLELVRPKLAEQDTQLKRAIPIEKRVAIAMWRL